MMSCKNTIISILAVLFTFLLSTTSIAQDRFITDEHPEVHEILGELAETYSIPAALEDAGTNWLELWDALRNMDEEWLDDACWLVSNMPHLDRLEMTEDVFREHVRFAFVTKYELPYDVPDELFREYILTYRINDEPVRAWREEIWYLWPWMIGETPADTALAVNRWVADNISPRERGFFGPRPDPMSIIKARSGTESDITTVAIAICKTFGVPARRACIEVLGEEAGEMTWVEIFSGGDWLPMYPDNPDAFGDTGYIEREHPNNVTVVSVSSAFGQEVVTGRYTETGTINCRFTRNGEEIPDFEDFSINAWNDGAWLPLDDIWLGSDDSDETPGMFSVEIGDGVYMLIAGVRNARGDAFIRSDILIVRSGDMIERTVAIDIPASEMDAVDLIHREIILPELTLTSTLNEEFTFPADFTGRLTCLTLFDPASEPCVRMIPMISEWCQQNDADFLGIGLNTSSADVSLGTDSSESRCIIINDPDGGLISAFGLIPNDEGNFTNLPLVILMGENGGIIYFEEGLNLSVADILTRALEIMRISM